MLSADILQKILQFRRVREWEQFHSPRNLATAITIEAAELLEPFRWSTIEGATEITRTHRKEISDEMADLAILLAYLAHDLAIDLESAIESKLSENEVKYPVETFRGSSKKYSEALGRKRSE